MKQKIAAFFLMAISCFILISSTAEGKDKREKESIKSLMHIQSDDEIISYVLSDDSSFAAIIIRSETESGLSFYILEKDNNGWKISACNESGMLREFDPLYLPRLGTGPNGSEEQPENEIYIQYESAESTGWDESLTIKKDVNGWNVSEYAFFIYEDHPYCPFQLFVINDPIDPEFNCLAQCSYCLKNCNFDVSISSFNRYKLRNGIKNMFDYDAIEAWITRNPDIENYSNYYDWARNR